MLKDLGFHSCFSAYTSIYALLLYVGQWGVCIIWECNDMYDWTSVLTFTIRIRRVGVSEQGSLSFMERHVGFFMNSYKSVSDLLPFGAIKVGLSRPGMFKPCTFQRKVCSSTGSWEITSTTLQYPIWQQCYYLPVALNPTRWFILTMWLMVGVLALF